MAAETQKKPMEKMKRIFLVDDHPMMREGLARLITEAGKWEICGFAETSASAIEQIPKLQPDLVTLDISLPDKNGLELIKDLLALIPDLRILVFSMHDEMLYAERVMRAGAKGYLMKGESTEALTQALESILEGGVFLSSTASNHLLKNLSGTKSQAQFGLDRLTDRELEVFELIGRGKNTAQIAEHLHISPKTVDAHRANMKTKLGLPDAPALMRGAVLWIEHGMNEGLDRNAAT